MRQIGNLPNRVLASRFAAYLITENVSCEAEEDDGEWSIWVHDEQRIDDAKRELEEFRLSPEAEKYQDREAAAERKIREEQQRRLEAQRNTVDVRTTRRFGQATPPAPFVNTLIVLSVVITLFTGFGKGGDPGSLKAGITSHMEFVTRADYKAQDGDPLANIKKGQIWRFVTPIFPHLDILHLIFNMFWLYQLGRALEWRMGAPQLALFVLVVAAVSNTAQAMTPPSMWTVMGGPFGFGMSGVVYGLFGYTWLKGQADPTSGLALPPTLVFLMIGWLFLCMTPYQSAANSAHVGGLIAGMLIAQVR